MDNIIEGRLAAGIVDGLVCVSLTGPGQPEIVMRLPKLLAAELAGRLLLLAAEAPNSYPSGPNAR